MAVRSPRARLGTNCSSNNENNTAAPAPASSSWRMLATSRVNGDADATIGLLSGKPR